MRKYLSVKSILEFVELCEKEKMDPSVIMLQLKMFCHDERGVELHDNCVLLMDGLYDRPMWA